MRDSNWDEEAVGTYLPLRYDACFDETWQRTVPTSALDGAEGTFWWTTNN